MAAASTPIIHHMSSVPDGLLEKLTCECCRNFLSVPPIRCFPDGRSVCGRCVNKEDNDAVQNKPYETILEFIMFPCMNKQFGCMETRTGKNMYEHETKCPYRRVNCPTFLSTSCDWLGEVDNLLEHFETNHVTCLMKEPSFEVNFVHNYNEICLLPYADSLFLVKKHGDSELQKFWCSIATIFVNEADRFQYFLKLKNPSNNSDIEFPPKFASSLKDEEGIEIKTNEMQEILHNPSTIVAEIEIVEYNCPEKENRKPTIVNDKNLEMLKIIECPVCFEYMVPPIFQCTGGHSLCGECKSQVHQCPTCEKPFGDTQNYAVESFTAFLMYPCKNNERGCEMLSPAKEIKQHEKLCIFGAYSCPTESYTDCKWSGKRVEILKHCKEFHTDNIMESQFVSLPFDESCEDGDDDECFIIKYLKDIFILHWLWSAEDKEFYWSLQLIGPIEDSEKYYFDLDIIDRSGGKSRIFMRGPCESFSEKKLAFERGRSFLFLSFDQVKPLINEVFSFKISICKD